jgi:hypothetical protein
VRSTLFLALASVVLGGCFLFKSDDTGDTGPDGGLGSSCAAADECGAGLVCAADVCINPGTVGIGGSCSASRDCAAGLQCALSTGCARRPAAAPSARRARRAPTAAASCAASSTAWEAPAR